MSYVYEHTIQHYIEEERERCAGLVKALVPASSEVGTEQAFLLWCINAPVYPSEIEDQRKRFNELQPVDEFEDLM
jgi:hypothetical protein